MRDLFYFILVAFCIIRMYNDHKCVNEYGPHENNFLKEISINNETHIIVDYRFLQGNYVLDNGFVVDEEVVKKLLGENYGK